MFTALATFPQGFELPPGQPIELKMKSSNPKYPEVKVPIIQQQRRMMRAPFPKRPAAAAVTPGTWPSRDRSGHRDGPAAGARHAGSTVKSLAGRGAGGGHWGRLAFAANGLSPHGLELSKNFFPGSTQALPRPAGRPNQGTYETNANPPAEPLTERLRKDGLQLADGNVAVQLFRNPRREQDGVIFIDARDDQHYEAGHIPGAYHFDRFHPEDYLSNVVQVCLTAQRIVFYCNGGDCDDSEHAAIMLRDSIGIPKQKVFVYGGGMAEWTSNGLPIEVGARNSGQLTNVVQRAASSPVEGTNR